MRTLDGAEQGTTEESDKCRILTPVHSFVYVGGDFTQHGHLGRERLQCLFFKRIVGDGLELPVELVDVSPDGGLHQKHPPFSVDYRTRSGVFFRPFLRRLFRYGHVESLRSDENGKIFSDLCDKTQKLIRELKRSCDTLFLIYAHTSG